MAEFQFDDYHPSKRDFLVLKSIQPHHSLMKTNRFLLILVFLLISLVFILSLVLIPRQNLLEEISRHKIVESTQNPLLNSEINTLKSQMFSLVSGSIESKLKSLEDNIRKGSVTESLDSLQEIRSQVKILSNYNQDTNLKAEQVIVDQRVINELSELKGLIYLTIGSCGLMIAAFTSIWIRHRYLLSHQPEKPVFLSQEDYQRGE